MALAGCSGQKQQAATRSAEPRVRITQFYTSTPVIPKGESGRLCYGVEGATAVRLDPPVEELKPSLTRCFEVKPAADTTYTLTAEDRNGNKVTQTATVTLGGAAPKLVDTSVNKASARAGEEITVCWTAKNATSVKAGPGKFLRGGVAAKDCVIDHPTRTTTYNVTVSNAQGLQDTAAVTVQVK